MNSKKENSINQKLHYQIKTTEIDNIGNSQNQTWVSPFLFTLFLPFCCSEKYEHVQTLSIMQHVYVNNNDCIILNIMNIMQVHNKHSMQNLDNKKRHIEQY